MSVAQNASRQANELTLQDAGAGNTMGGGGGVGYRYRIVTATAEGRTISAPTEEGETLSITLITDGGDLTLTFGSGVAVYSATFGASPTAVVSAVFADVGDTMEFRAIDVAGTKKWLVTSNHGASLS